MGHGYSVIRNNRTQQQKKIDDSRWRRETRASQGLLPGIIPWCPVSTLVPLPAGKSWSIVTNEGCHHVIAEFKRLGLAKKSPLTTTALHTPLKVRLARNYFRNCRRYRLL